MSWHRESWRHSLAAKGISTRNSYYLRLWKGATPNLPQGKASGGFVVMPYDNSPEAIEKARRYIKKNNPEADLEDIFIPPREVSLYPATKDIDRPLNIDALSKTIAHEEMHKAIADVAGYEASEKMDNLVRRAKPIKVDGETYLNIDDPTDLSLEKKRMADFIEEGNRTGKISHDDALKMRIMLRRSDL